MENASLYFSRQRFYKVNVFHHAHEWRKSSPPHRHIWRQHTTSQGSKTGDLSPDEMLLLMRVLLSCCWMDAVIVELTAYNTFAHFLNSYLG